MFDFRLQISSLGNAHYIGLKPRYEDSANKVFAIEPNQVFQRETWDLEVIFQRETEYNLINDRPIDTKFTLKAYLSESDPIDNYVWKGRFSKTDCEIDEDNKTITVKPITEDRYDKLITGLDKEFDLIALAPEITPVNIVRQPIFQVHLEGSEIISNFVGGSYYETEKVGVFSTASNAKEAFLIPGDSTVLTIDVSGEYDYQDLGGLHFRKDGAFYLKENLGSSKWEIWQDNSPSADTLVYTANTTGALPVLTTPFTSGLVFTSETSAEQCTIYGVNIQCRILTNELTVNGVGTSEILEGDNNFETGQHERVISLFNAVTLTQAQKDEIFLPAFGHSTEATRYNKFIDTLLFDGEYYVQPSSEYLPIQRNEWTGFSLWFYFNSNIQALQTAASTDITIKHGYKLPDVLTALLSEIDEDLTHDELNAFSNFLYGSNSIRGSRRYPIITPKSNLIAGQYDEPASKANIKLSEVLTMLKYVYNVWFYIDTDNKFRLEHHEYFRNGGAYHFPNVGTDLTTLLEPKTGKRWDYQSNKYTYDKQDIPEQVTTKWMDKQSFAFEGAPILCLSEYAEKGNLEERSISLFSSDVDYIMANPNDISKDGFVLMDCELSSGVYSVPFVDLTDYGHEGVNTQNGYLSLAYLTHWYHKHNLPTYSVNINGTDTTALSVKRTKVQEIEFASFEFDPMELITTGLGTGKIDEFTQNLHSGAIKGKIKHDVQ